MRIRKRNMVAALDIGTGTIKAALAEITARQEIRILGITRVESSGLKKGNIIDIEGTGKAIDKCLSDLERLTGIGIYDAVLGFSGTGISTVNNHAIVAVGNPNYEINRDDRERVLQSASNIPLPPDKTLLHTIERQYIVDGYDGVKDPVGMVGSRLEADITLVSAASAAIQNMQRSTSRVNLQINRLIYNPILVGESVLLDAEKEMGVLLVDLGAGTTEIALFQGGSMLYSSVLPLGDEYIDRDLAIVLKITIEEARRIKREYGVADPKLLDDEKQVVVINIQGNEVKEVSQQIIAEIINARVAEIAQIVYAEIKKCGILESIPGGLVLAGGGAELPGIGGVMAEYLGTTVRLGSPDNLRGLPAEMNRPLNAAVLGGVIYAAQYNGGLNYEETSLTGIINKVNYWLKDLFS